jgi:hypothetical protein
MDNGQAVVVTVLVVALTVMLGCMLFSLGRSSAADDCERYGKFYDGETAFECSSSADTTLGEKR